MEEQNTITEEQDVKKEHKPFKRYIALGVGLVVAIAGAFVIHDALMYQSTDDAYVETTTVQVAPRVSGQIISRITRRLKKATLLQKLTRLTMKSLLHRQRLNMKELF